MIDSGTLGTNGSVQVVVPFLTESYSATSDPVDRPVPMCTLRHFPNVIEHTIEWARDNFAGLFTIPAQQADEYMRDPEKFAVRVSKCTSVIDKKELITNVKQILGASRPKHFLDCIIWVCCHRLSIYIPSIIHSYLFLGTTTVRTPISQ